MSRRPLRHAAVALALGALGFGQVAQAACIDRQTIVAARINEFETMMMVASLRCTRIGYDMRTRFDNLATAHQASFGQATSRLRHYLGGDGVDVHSGAFDTFATMLANRYGGGKTTFDNCMTLDEVAGELAKAPDTRVLSAIAETMIARPMLDEVACSVEH